MKRLVGLCGVAGAGKDTAARGLTSRGWTRVAFADPLKKVATRIGWDGEKDTHGRILLQELGHAVREHVAEDAWLQAAAKAIDKVDGPVVVTDVRYPNEVEFIRDRGGLLVWIDRPGYGPANGHVSENAVTANDANLILVNTKSLTTTELAGRLRALVA